MDNNRIEANSIYPATSGDVLAKTDEISFGVNIWAQPGVSDFEFINH